MHGTWPEFRRVSIDKCFIDTSYQRPELTNTLVQTIASDFQPAKFGGILVSERSDSRLATIDGQQRSAGARVVGAVEVPAFVLIGLTIPQEARLYVEIQRDRKNMRPVQRFKAELVGEIPRALEIRAALERHGLTLTESSGHSAPPEAVSAVVKMERVYDRFGLPTLEMALEVILASWPQTRSRFQGEIIEAVGMVIAQDDIELGRLIDALADDRHGKIGSPQKLMERSASLRAGSGGLGGGSTGYTVKVIRMDYQARRGGGGRKRTRQT